MVLSGDEAEHGRHIQQAVNLAVEQANARGDLPFVVETVVGDDMADPQQALLVAEQFIADDQVLGVIGTMNSDTSLATAPLYHQARLVQISPAASNVELTRKGYDTFFRLIPHDNIQGEDGARFAVSVLGARRIAVLHDQSEFGEPLARTFAATADALGADIVLFRAIQRGETDFRDVAEEVREVSPDLVYFGVIEAEGRHLARQIRDAGVRAPYLGTDGLKPSHYLATPGAGVPGPYHTNAGTDIQVTPSAKAFVDAYQKRYGEIYSVYTAEGYDAANILIAAFARAKTLDRPGVLAAVAQTRDFPGASGRITFDAFGDITDPKIGIYRLEGDQMIFLGYTHDLRRL